MKLTGLKTFQLLTCRHIINIEILHTWPNTATHSQNSTGKYEISHRQRVFLHKIASKEAMVRDYFSNATLTRLICELLRGKLLSRYGDMKCICHNPKFILRGLCT